MPLEKANIAGALWRIVLALAAGVACGALLAAIFIYVSFGETLVFGGLLVVMIFYGGAIAAVCVPIWLILAKFGLDSAFAAAALGFFATATFLALTHSTTPDLHTQLMTNTIIPYALCGAAGALVTWLVGRLLSED